MKRLIIGNWKMNPPTFKEAKKLFAASRLAAEKARSVTLVVAPPTLFMRELRAAYRGRAIQFAAQNANDEIGGAHTGEISMRQLVDAGAKFVIIGHAERRALGENNETIAKKTAAAIALKITPILCVGEHERTQGGEYFAQVREQLRIALSGVEAKDAGKVVVTYEPLWAIGKQEAMQPRQMHEMSIFIRKCIVDLKGAPGMQVKILYGGSLDASSAPAMLKGGDVQGLLVGRASENPVQIAALLEAIEDDA